MYVKKHEFTYFQKIIKRYLPILFKEKGACPLEQQTKYEKKNIERLKIIQRFYSKIAFCVH